jgi:NTP pyrophosphatase (non-canonical NTP hydrolase)
MKTDLNHRNLIECYQRRQYSFVEKQGWHNKTRLEALALLSSEVGEAINEARNPRKGVGESYYLELADIFLRLVDLAEVEGIDLEYWIQTKMRMNENRDFSGKEK